MKIMIGGETLEASEKQIADFKATLKKDEVRVWEPKLNQPYFTIFGSGAVERAVWYNEILERDRLAFGNCWRTEELAKAHSERLRVFNHLWQIAEAIGRSKPGEERWTFDWKSDEWQTREISQVSRHSDFEFPTYEACERFIKTGQQWLDILYPKV